MSSATSLARIVWASGEMTVAVSLSISGWLLTYCACSSGVIPLIVALSASRLSSAVRTSVG